MTSAIAGIVIAALLVFSATDTPKPAGTPATSAASATPVIAVTWVESVASESPRLGTRVESDSFTEPAAIALCIAYNINRKMPELRVRNVSGDGQNASGYLVLTLPEPAPTTFGVIRIEPGEDGSRLTTWLPDRSLTMAPEDLARRLVAGC